MAHIHVDSFTLCVLIDALKNAIAGWSYLYSEIIIKWPSY